MRALSRKGRSVIWAVDPFEGGLLPSESAVREMAESANRASLSFLPVHVLVVRERQWETGELPRVLELQAALDRYVRGFALGPAVQARVLVDENGTRHSAVRALLELASAEGAEWIVVSSHGRSGLERLMLGSFAELLVEESPVPVAFLPRQVARAEALAARLVLFPTDLSEMGRCAFTRFLSIAARERLEIAIFHALSYPVPPLDFGLGPAGIGPSLPESFLDDQKNWAKERGEALVQEVRARGVRAGFLPSVGPVPAITGRAVLAAARKERARMILMASLSGPVLRFVAGSVPQEVFRSGRLLTWLYGPRALGAREANAA